MDGDVCSHGPAGGCRKLPELFAPRWATLTHGITSPACHFAVWTKSAAVVSTCDDLAGEGDQRQAGKSGLSFIRQDLLSKLAVRSRVRAEWDALGKTLYHPRSTVRSKRAKHPTQRTLTCSGPGNMDLTCTNVASSGTPETLPSTSSPQQTTRPSLRRAHVW